MAMTTTSEKDVLAHITSTTKKLSETNKNLMDKIKTLEETSLHLKSKGGNQGKQGGHTTRVNDFE